MLAKNREGRIVKVEGNPAHPVSGGKLCMRGQASLHGLYNPDRFRGPMLRNAAGGFDPITWERGEAILAAKLSEAVRKGEERPHRRHDRPDHRIFKRFDRDVAK